MYALMYAFYHVHQQIVSEAARQPQDTEMLILTPWVDQSLTRGHVTQASLYTSVVIYKMSKCRFAFSYFLYNMRLESYAATK